MFETVLNVLGLLLSAATLLPVLRRQSWWVRIFDFPRLQIGVGLLLVLGLRLAWTPWTTAALALSALMTLCLVVQAHRMWPYTRLARAEVQDSRGTDSSRGLRLLFANVLQTNRDADALLRVVRQADPDVVLALETDAWWASQLDALRETHPHTVLQPQDNTYGMVLYSRVPLIDPEVRFLIEPDIPSIHLRLRMGHGEEVQLHCLHPRPPSPTESDSSVPRDAELLIVGRAIKKNPGPVVVMGDMNDVAWSHTSDLFRHTSGLLDPRVGRGFFNSFNAKHRLIRFPLDHFFHSNDFRLVEFCRLGYFGSDHFPVYIHLSHEPQAEQEQPEHHADAAEREEASEKIAEAK